MPVFKDTMLKIREIEVVPGVFITKAILQGQSGFVNYRISPAEMKVIKLTALGYSNKVIADTLRIKERTVQSHLANIFDILDVDNRTACVLKLLRDGVLMLEDLKEDKRDKNG
jgi:DNA-binding NarL/FixJ family response regulator